MTRSHWRREVKVTSPRGQDHEVVEQELHVSILGHLSGLCRLLWEEGHCYTVTVEELGLTKYGIQFGRSAILLQPIVI